MSRPTISPLFSSVWRHSLNSVDASGANRCIVGAWVSEMRSVRPAKIYTGPATNGRAFGIIKPTSKTRSRPEHCPSIPVGNYPLSPRIRILPAPGEFYGKAASFALLSTIFSTIDSLLGRRDEST